MLRILKRVAQRAGLNLEDFYLHKFRATFATTVLRSNRVDLTTLQKWMGHTDLASTMRYLSAARGEGVRAKVDAVWSATA
jgi:integrase